MALNARAGIGSAMFSLIIQMTLKLLKPYMSSLSREAELINTFKILQVIMKC